MNKGLIVIRKDPGSISIECQAGLIAGELVTVVFTYTVGKSGLVDPHLACGLAWGFGKQEMRD